MRNLVPYHFSKNKKPIEAKGEIKMKNLFVNQLEEKLQKEIEKQVTYHLRDLEGLRHEELNEAVENAMNSRVSDLSEIIDLDELEVN